MKIKIDKPMRRMLIGMGILMGVVLIYHFVNMIIRNNYLEEESKKIAYVSTTKVQYQEWQPKLKTFGSLRAVYGITVTSEISGLIRDIYFEDGQAVKKGDALVQLNADDDIALLQALEAQAKLAEVTYERDKKQYEINVLSKEVLDMDLYNMENQNALVKQQAAIVAKKTIRAPFSGKIGVCLTNLGEFLSPGDPIVTLQALDELYIDFYIPERNLTSLKEGQTVNFTTDAFLGKVFTGGINAIEPIIKESTRTIHVEGVIENSDGGLLPGMYVSVEVVSGEPQRKLTIPQAAVSYNPYGDLVYVVTKKNEQDEEDNDEEKESKEDDEKDKEEDKNEKDEKQELYAEQQFVTLGEMRGDQVEVLDGLKKGDEIVTSGQMKLKNHSRILINNKVVPTNDANPNVDNEQKNL